MHFLKWQLALILDTKYVLNIWLQTQFKPLCDRQIKIDIALLGLTEPYRLKTIENITPKTYYYSMLNFL